MVVRTQSNGAEILGVRVGSTNARRYFPKSVEAVELCLDDLHIRCTLPQSFWDGKPEIHDPRLCEWLKFRVLRDRRNSNPIALHMVQSGANTFTLQSLSSPRRRHTPVAPAA